MILTQDQFIRALASTTSAIHLLDSERNKIRDLSELEARACMIRGGYIAVGKASRVRYLQALRKDVMIPVMPREHAADPSFWIDRHLWTWSAADFARYGAPLVGGMTA